MQARDELLKLNGFLRATEGVRKTDGLRLALQIPIEDHQRLVAANPALASKDAKERTDAWHAFMHSPVSLPYRVSEKI
jgi:hypothetical protein